MMLKFLTALVCALALAHSHPWDLPVSVTRNTIFGDEKLPGEVFENIDAFTNIQLYSEGVNPYRLPNSTKPIRYDVFWDINPDGHEYSGTVAIELVATQPGVSEIIIHSSHNALSDITLTKKGDTTSMALSSRTDEQYHFLVIRPAYDLEYNNEDPIVYILSVSFGAIMRTDMYGIYKSWFRTDTRDLNSDISWMATTQFQGTAARFAFPCYDEPSFKAKFDIRIRRPNTHRSWSCTRIGNSDTSNPSYTIDEYLTTPEMSTYLLALIVADYGSLTNNDGAVQHELIARAQALDSGQGEYAFTTAQKLLAEMDDHTAMNFIEVEPNLKMTQAAIPDFGAGAMENWGLLTYREAYLLSEDEHTNSNYRQLIAYILSHEIAHMWFGNLVTCAWWDVLWLNEGFARYYQYFLTNEVEITMGFETRFIVEQVHTSLLADSVIGAHPLTHSGIGSPASVSSMFSTISYNKGASIIRQTEHFIGYNVHREGLRNYLRVNAHKSVQPIDLFVELEDAAIHAGALQEYGPEFSFIEYYKSWTEQPGHPVLNVRVNHTTGLMTITQRRFDINTRYSNTDYNYIVPITFATASNPDFENTKPTHVLTDTVTVINRGSTGDEWVIFNKQQSGFYRVNYDEYTWNLIAIALRGPQRTLIHEYNRAQIVNDLFQFARSEIMTYNEIFEILEFLAEETDYAPWLAAITGFNWMRNRLATTTPELQKLNELIMNWARTVMEQLGYEPSPGGEDFMRSYLRFQLAPVMCNVGVTACHDTAKAQLQALMNDGIDVPADSRNWVYCNGLRQGDSEQFNFLWNRFQTENLYTEKILLLSVLGCTRDATSLNIFLNAIVEVNLLIRPQDYNTAFNSAVSGNEENTQIVFSFIQANLERVIEAFGTATTPLNYVSSRLRTQEEVTAFRNWVDENEALLGDSYENIYNNANLALESMDWVNSVTSDLNDYFDGSGGSFNTSTEGVVITTQPTTITPAPLPQPVPPQLPDSAVSTLISTFLISIGVIVNFVF